MMTSCPNVAVNLINGFRAVPNTMPGSTRFIECTGRGRQWMKLLAKRWWKHHSPSDMAWIVCLFLYEDLQHIPEGHWSLSSSLEKCPLVSALIAFTQNLPCADVLFRESFFTKSHIMLIILFSPILFLRPVFLLNQFVILHVRNVNSLAFSFRVLDETKPSGSSNFHGGNLVHG